MGKTIVTIWNMQQFETANGELSSHTFNKAFLKRPPWLQDSELENAIYELLGLPMCFDRVKRDERWQQQITLMRVDHE